jgi:YHS domain-containing protein
MNLPLEQSIERGEKKQHSSKKDLISLANLRSVMQLRYKQTDQDAKLIQNLYKTKYSNLYILDGSKNRLNALGVAEEVINKTLNVQHLKALALPNMPYSVETLPISADEVRAGLYKSGYQDYCPVNWVLNGNLFKSPWIDGAHTKLTAEYRGCFYKFEDQKNMEIFLKDPHQFIGNANLPSIRPRSLLPEECKNIQESHLEFQGYSPVSYYESLQKAYRDQYDGIVKGSTKFIVEYNAKYYAFVSESEQISFSR